MTYEGTLCERELVKGACRNIKLYSILRCEYRWA